MRRLAMRPPVFLRRVPLAPFKRPDLRAHRPGRLTKPARSGTGALANGRWPSASREGAEAEYGGVVEGGDKVGAGGG